MKYLVLIKQVPIVSQLAFDPDTRTLKRDGVRLEVSSFDVRALLRALELRTATGGEIVALTMGPPQAREALVHCLALGADRGVHLVDRAFAGADTLATARALALALRREGFDLVLCGRASVDAETGQVGPEVAELLDLPQVTNARSLEVDLAARRIRAERETDASYETVECALPALVTAGEDLAPERFPRRADKEAAKSKPITEVTARDLAPDVTGFGLAGSPTWVAGIETIEVSREGRIIPGDLELAVPELVRALEARGLFAPTEEPVPSPSEQVDGPERAGGGPAAPRVQVDDGGLWVLAEAHGTELRRVTRELLAKAVALAGRDGGEVTAVVIGHDVHRHAADLASSGAERVLVADHPALADYDTETYAGILAELIAARRPSAVLIPATWIGRDLAPRVAARLGLGLTGDCIDLTLDDDYRLVQWKPAFGGNVVAPILSRTRPALATVRPGVLPPGRASGESGALNIERISSDGLGTRRVSLLTRCAIPGLESALALEEAAIAIGVGTGIGGPAALPEIEALGRALGGAALAATRDVTDKGWLPRHHQVGLTGRAIAPRFYFAVAIRGAFEHMVGVRRAGTIVAIDRNPNAPIFKQADLGIVAEWEPAVRALTAALETFSRGRSM